MKVSKVEFGNDTVMDITDSTVTENNLLSGEIAYGSDGERVVGTVTVPTDLDDLSDVTITSPTAGQALVYDNGEWINGDVASTDEKVKQTATNTNANYEVLFSETADNTTRTEGARKYSNLKFNPSTGNLQATQLNGVTIGNSPKFTDTTYTGTGLISINSSNVISTSAEVNQNAFSTVTVTSGSTDTDVSADAKTDSLNLVQGSRITLTPDASNKKITIAASDVRVRQTLDESSDKDKPILLAYSDAGTTTANVDNASYRNNKFLFNLSKVKMTMKPSGGSWKDLVQNPTIHITKDNVNSAMNLIGGDTKGGRIVINTYPGASSGTNNLYFDYWTDAQIPVSGNTPTSRMIWNGETNNLQLTKLNGVDVGNSPKFTDTTYTGTGLISINSSNEISTTAEENQNAFSTVGIKVGSTTTNLAADAKMDTLTIVQGSNITLTPTTSSDSFTIAAKDTTYTGTGLISINSNNEISTTATDNTGTVTSVTIKGTSPIVSSSESAIVGSGTRTISHATSGATAGSYGDSSAQTPSYGGTFKVPYVTVNDTGHVTGISEHTVKIPASDNTDEKVKQTPLPFNTGSSIQWYRLALGRTRDNTEETNPIYKTSNLVFSDSNEGGTSTTPGKSSLRIGNTTNSGNAGNQYGELQIAGKNNRVVCVTTDDLTATHYQTLQNKDGTIALTDDIPGVVSTTANGLAPMVTSTTAYLRGDGTWATPSNNYDRNRYNVAITAGAAITAKNIIVARASDGKYVHLNTSKVAFDIRYPILYANADIASGSTGSNNYDVLAIAIATTQSLALTAYKPVYIKGTLVGTTFTTLGTAPLTQTVPSSADGYVYMLLGIAYSTTNLYLSVDHRIFAYSTLNGFREIIPSVLDWSGPISITTSSSNRTNLSSYSDFHEFYFVATLDSSNKIYATMIIPMIDIKSLQNTDRVFRSGWYQASTNGGELDITINAIASTGATQTWDIRAYGSARMNTATVSSPDIKMYYR